MSQSNSSIPNIGSLTVNGLRFGFEDVVAAENRAFDLTGFDFNFVGIGQDDTSLQILALDASGNLKFVDKTTIGGGGGGTVDNSTAHHLIRKAGDGSFKDTNIIDFIDADGSSKLLIQYDIINFAVNLTGFGNAMLVHYTADDYIASFNVLGNEMEVFHLTKVNADADRQFTAFFGTDAQVISLSAITGAKSITIGDSTLVKPAIIVSETGDFINLFSNSGKYTIQNLPQYATPAAATSAGLLAGSLYKSSVTDANGNHLVAIL